MEAESMNPGEQAATRAGNGGGRAPRASVLVYLLTSLLLLTPCFWQPRIQAGDLSSHIYNSWLAQLIESGRAEGLVIVNQTTNVMFDYLLSGLFKAFGAEAAQRIAVSVSVLVFVWGSFAFVCTVSRRRPWHLMPCIAMLGYGWVFHMGFFNFYLSLGLCFWALALLWRPTPRRVAATAPVLALAYLAHALPVAWACGLIAYLWIARGMAPRRRGYLTAAALLLMACVHAAVNRTMLSQWSPQQFTMSTGADQLWVFGMKYYLLLMALLTMWGLLFITLLHMRGPRRVVLSLPFQFCVLSAAVVSILPSTILLPGFHHALVYIAERMSLGVGICVCALLGAARPRQWERYAIVAMAAVFFCFLYVDERALNRFEDKMEGAVAQLTFGQRVFSSIEDGGSRVNALAHAVDRACIGRCYSYANYEPSTAQFRIRAVSDGGLVVARYGDSIAMQRGTYVMKERDLPAYQVYPDAAGRLLTRSMKAGALCGSTSLRVVSDWIPSS